MSAFTRVGLLCLATGLGTVAEAATLTPPSAANCASLAAATGAAIPGPIKKATGPVSYPGGSGVIAGQGCVITAKGTGVRFGRSFQAIAAKLGTMLTSRRWAGDPTAGADGPTGTVVGYRQGSALAMVSVQWTPAKGACSANQPIASCTPALSKMLYAVEVDAARGG